MSTPTKAPEAPNVPLASLLELARLTAPTEYVGQDRAAAFLAHSPRTLEMWRLQGFGPPHYKAGRRVLYKLSDCQAFIEAGRRTSTSDRGAA